MAFVYKAHHELLDELRALKVIKPDLARDPEFMGRFKNEAIRARKLNHPNAVRVDDLDIAEDGLPFIAMELVVGDTLKTWFSAPARCPSPWSSTSPRRSATPSTPRTSWGSSIATLSPKTSS